MNPPTADCDPVRFRNADWGMHLIQVSNLRSEIRNLKSQGVLTTAIHEISGLETLDFNISTLMIHIYVVENEQEQATTSILADVSMQHWGQLSIKLLSFFRRLG